MPSLKRKGSAEIITGKPLRRGPGSDPRLASSDCLIGVEIELEEYSLSQEHILANKWTAHGDGSLQNGREFVFAEPLKGSHITQAVDAFFDALRHHNSSPRAGTHIHVDCQDVEDVEALYRMIVIIMCIEPALFRIGAEDDGRMWNNYCVPLGKAELQALADIISDPSTDALHRAVRSMDRYRGANLSSLSRHSTIEFRCFPAITTKQVLYTWINLCLLIKKAAVSIDIAALDLAEQLSTPEGVTSLIAEHFNFGDIAGLLAANLSAEERASFMSTFLVCTQAKPYSSGGAGSARSLREALQQPAAVRYLVKHYPNVVRDYLPAAAAGGDPLSSVQRAVQARIASLNDTF